MAYGMCKGGPLDGLMMETAPTGDGDKFTVKTVDDDPTSYTYEWDGDYEVFVSDRQTCPGCGDEDTVDNAHLHRRCNLIP